MSLLQPPPLSSQQSQPPAAPKHPRIIPLQSPESDRSSGGGELRSLDCNLASLCDHIQNEGFNSGAFSDIVVRAMDTSYRLHRLILSRSSYFRNMLHGPWKEAGLPTLVLHIDDPNVNSEAITLALAYLYGHYPKLNDNNTFRVLAAASFLDLQDLCSICTDFIISELCTSNFLQYQVFAESQDYGIYGERVKNACWGYLCQNATMEFREVLPKLSSQTLEMLLTSDKLWVPNEEKRFELALYILQAKGTMSEVDNSEQDTRNSDNASVTPDSPRQSGKGVIDSSLCGTIVESALQQLCIQEKAEGITAAQNFLVDISDCGIGFESELSQPQSVEVRHPSSPQVQGSNYSFQTQQCALSNPLADPRETKASSSYFELRSGVEIARNGVNDSAMEGPSGESPCYQLNNIWLCGNQSRDPSSVISAGNFSTPNDLGRCKMPSWGGRIVGRRQVKSAKGFQGIPDEDYDAFVNIFEGGSLLYCNMSFEALLDVRKQLEELGFPCKAVNDSLWLQMLLCQRVQAIGSDTCKNCCLTSNACACRQAYGYSHASSSMNYYQQGHDRNIASGTIGNIYLADAQGEGSALFGPVRVHMRGAIDGLAGIGRQTTYVQGDGLTALVGLSQGNNVLVHADQMDRAYEADPPNRFVGAASNPKAGGTSLQVPESCDQFPVSECESSEGSSISLDLKTPLRHFPPFRFGVEFEDVHRLIDGQVKHSPEVFYAGSLWKVSVQTFNDEDPQGRRTLGLFLHRRKAEVTDSLRKVHMYVDSREKVTARYQLICPSKREVMVFGSFNQTGTLLPKAPKGWGWRTALLFDELADLLQAGALRVAAVVQLV